MWKFQRYYRTLIWCVNSVGSGNIKNPYQDYGFISFSTLV